jgi:hypothetical protein
MHTLAIHDLNGIVNWRFQLGDAAMGNPTADAVERQISAMSVGLFEVGLFKPADPARSTNEPENRVATVKRRLDLRPEKPNHSALVLGPSFDQ